MGKSSCEEQGKQTCPEDVATEGREDLDAKVGGHDGRATSPARTIAVWQSVSAFQREAQPG
jgi:hypothetical protein